MANMPGKYTADHKAAVSDTADEEKRTTLSLSITVSDKKALKMMAVEQETTIAAIIHEWVQEHRGEGGKVNGKERGQD